ncbi:MAG: ABC transporter permease [Aquiluna sp.]|nr:ABC transporter permease [Aquiluna sp.]
MSEFRVEQQSTRRQGRAALIGKSRQVFLGAMLPILILALWQVLSSSGAFSVSQLPPPAEVVSGALGLIERGTLWGHIAISLQRVFAGFALGAALGIALGSAVGLSKFVSQLLQPTIGALRAVPSLAWVPLLLIWMGIYEEPKITLIAIGAFFPVFTTVASGLAAVDRNLIEVGRAYGLKSIKLVTRILLPASSPIIFSGLRLGLAQAWLFLVAAELIASSKGLGFLLLDSQNTARTDVLFVAIILLALLGKLSDVVITQVEKRALRWI